MAYSNSANSTNADEKTSSCKGGLFLVAGLLVGGLLFTAGHRVFRGSFPALSGSQHPALHNRRVMHTAAISSSSSSDSNKNSAAEESQEYSEEDKRGSRGFLLPPPNCISSEDSSDTEDFAAAVGAAARPHTVEVGGDLLGKQNASMKDERDQLEELLQHLTSASAGATNLGVVGERATHFFCQKQNLAGALLVAAFALSFAVFLHRRGGQQLVDLASSNGSFRPSQSNKNHNSHLGHNRGDTNNFRGDTRDQPYGYNTLQNTLLAKRFPMIRQNPSLTKILYCYGLTSPNWGNWWALHTWCCRAGFGYFSFRMCLRGSPDASCRRLGERDLKQFLWDDFLCTLLWEDALCKHTGDLLGPIFNGGDSEYCYEKAGKLADKCTAFIYLFFSPCICLSWCLCRSWYWVRRVIYGDQVEEEGGKGG